MQRTEKYDMLQKVIETEPGDYKNFEVGMTAH